MHLTAMTHSGLASAATITVERAGGFDGEVALHTSFIRPKSAWRVRNTVHLSIAFIEVPAVSIMA